MCECDRAGPVSKTKRVCGIQDLYAYGVLVQGTRSLRGKSVDSGEQCVIFLLYSNDLLTGLSASGGLISCSLTN